MLIVDKDCNRLGYHKEPYLDNEILRVKDTDTNRYHIITFKEAYERKVLGIATYNILGVGLRYFAQSINDNDLFLMDYIESIQVVKNKSKSQIPTEYKRFNCVEAQGLSLHFGATDLYNYTVVVGENIAGWLKPVSYTLFDLLYLACESFHMYDKIDLHFGAKKSKEGYQGVVNTVSTDILVQFNTRFKVAYTKRLMQYRIDFIGGKTNAILRN